MPQYEEFYENSDYTNSDKFIGAESMGALNGHDWKRHRKILLPYFTKPWPIELFSNYCQLVINKWTMKGDNQEILLLDDLQRMTLDCLGKGLFDIEFNASIEPNNRLFHLWNTLNTKSNSPWYETFPILDQLPLFKRPEFDDEILEYDRLIEDFISQRMKLIEKKKADPKDNLLNAMISSYLKGLMSGLELEEIRDNMKLLILAGHDTTAYTLTSILYLLAKNPDIQSKLRSEILNTLNNPEKLTTPTSEQLPQMEYLTLVIKESMRLLTPASEAEREASQEYTLSNGITIPKGTVVSLNLWAIHHNPEFYENPGEFNPERFKLNKNGENQNWQPFLMGQRSCIGMSFSLTEIKVSLILLLQQFEFTLSENNPDFEKVRLNSNFMIFPKDLRLNVKNRLY
ncbi:cytochrome P450 [Conidiobolus coronatus NRRL 28638]|uniref:Cytochrome P450 n=1 Tax=Conidiobolus coronatus (strain ATCC 28846 / CBS 209.66 / NRRL 28638) TaxID=796925 RepID=A0A137NRY1_CONC2|nr:cytochrome P450 [Conidiobolus coronatus NRRL 28638]|eukprot:KXN65529.1 cytochrome P450 [Conidiobolus coronatus NRRL 28638]